MANRTLNSIEFPGLSDKYVIPSQADEFSSSSTYSEGVYVTYRGLFYRCTSAVTVPGGWTGTSNWTQSDIGTELSALNQKTVYDSSVIQGSSDAVTGDAVYKEIQTRVPVYGNSNNLLRNWDFGNPINQRGNTTYSGATQYTIDGWKTNNNVCSITINAGNILITANSAASYLMQTIGNLSSLAGQTVTFSVLSGVQTSGLMRFVVNGTSYAYEITGALDFQTITLPNPLTSLLVGVGADTNGSLTVYAVKLELGSQQTLVHQDSGSWVFNSSSDYQEELFKCSTSTVDSYDTYANKPNLNAVVRYYSNQVVQEGTSTTIMRIPAGNAIDPNITTDSVVLECVFSDPSCIVSNVTWTSYAGYVAFVGTCVSSTSANVVLGRKGN